MQIMVQICSVLGWGQAGVLSLVLAACYRGQGACVREVGGLNLEGLIASALMSANR